MWSWLREVGDSGRLPLLVCFAAYVITFATTRTITRMIRSGRGPFRNNVSSSGLHVHHAVPGIILLITGAFTAIAVDVDSPWSVVAGLLVGVGTSLVLDEFALILHLQDVYWTDEGRTSVELVSLALACLGLLLVGIRPFDMSDVDPATTAVATVVTTGTHVAFILVCVMKGKYKMALFGAFIPFFASISAIRLARPDSRWAKRRYSPAKVERATTRAAEHDARWDPILDRISDAVAGKPSLPDPTPSPSDPKSG